MLINDIRRRNFEFLFERFKVYIRLDEPEALEYGMLKKFAEKIGSSQAYMSHVNTGYKPVGPKLARKIEAALDLPDGWMDRSHDGKRTPEEETFAQSVMELYRADPEAAQAAILKAFAKKMRA